MSKKNKNTPTLDEIFRGIDPPSEEKLVSGKIPKELHLKRDEPGICFGKRSKKFPSHYVGVRQAIDSNCIAIGGVGSNKSVGVAKSTLLTWNGSVVVTDVKGELSDYYKELYLNGLVDRPPLVFDPTDVRGYPTTRFNSSRMLEKLMLFPISAPLPTLSSHITLTHRISSGMTEKDRS